VCVCSLRYPACNAHAPYCNLWPAPLYNIFLPYLIKCTIFGGGGNDSEIKCVFRFSLQLCPTHFLFQEEVSERDILVFLWSTRYFCPNLMELEFSPQIFKKLSNMKFRKNSSSESRVPCGRTDRLTDINLIVAFRNFTNAPQNDDKNDIAVTKVVLLHHIITNCNV
jgi:hypothetical protein